MAQKFSDPLLWAASSPVVWRYGNEDKPSPDILGEIDNEWRMEGMGAFTVPQTGEINWRIVAAVTEPNPFLRPYLLAILKFPKERRVKLQNYGFAPNEYDEGLLTQQFLSPAEVKVAKNELSVLQQEWWPLPATGLRYIWKDGDDWAEKIVPAERVDYPGYDTEWREDFPGYGDYLAHFLRTTFPETRTGIPWWEHFGVEDVTHPS